MKTYEVRSIRHRSAAEFEAEYMDKIKPYLRERMYKDIGWLGDEAWFIELRCLDDLHDLMEAYHTFVIDEDTIDFYDDYRE